MVLALVSHGVIADEAGPMPPEENDPQQELDLSGQAASESEKSGSGADASNPLSSASNLDLRVEYFDLDGSSYRLDLNTKGSVVVHPRIKFSFETHYWITEVTGNSENDMETVRLKPIFFLHDAVLDNSWKMRVAAGFEWIIDFDNTNRGIGSGADQLAPLFGLAFNNSDTGLTLIPLVQHFESYDGNDVSNTTFRFILLQPMPESTWVRVDIKAPFDWENNTEPLSAELELGKMITSSWGVYLTTQVGIGDDRPFDWSLGPAVRFRF